MWLSWLSDCFRHQRSVVRIQSLPKFYSCIYYQLYWKDENKEKRGRPWRPFKKSYMKSVDGALGDSNPGLRWAMAACGKGLEVIALQSFNLSWLTSRRDCKRSLHLSSLWNNSSFWHRDHSKHIERVCSCACTYMHKINSNRFIFTIGLTWAE